MFRKPSNPLEIRIGRGLDIHIPTVTASGHRAVQGAPRSALLNSVTSSQSLALGPARALWMTWQLCSVGAGVERGPADPAGEAWVLGTVVSRTHPGVRLPPVSGEGPGDKPLGDEEVGVQRG